MTKEELNDPELIKMLDDMADDRVGGKPQTRLDDIDHVYADPIDSRWEIDEMMNDLIMAEYVDENNGGEVVRGGIVISPEMSRTRAWRTAIVRKVGPDVKPPIRPGVYIRFGADKGIPSIQGKRKYIFLNAERVFCTLKPKEEAPTEE